MSRRPSRGAPSWALLFACLVLFTDSGSHSSARSYSLPFNSPPSAQATFPSQAYEIGGGSADVAVGDFNGDGFRDVATANRGVYDPRQGVYVGWDVSILLGYGDGTLAPEVHLATSHAPESVVAADFNRDGKDDLAVAFAGRGEVGIFVSNGDGSFGQPAIYSQGTSGGTLKAADFNSDGRVDLVATAGGGSAAVWIGAGDGSFSLGGTFLGGERIAAVADINADGDQDVVFRNLQLLPTDPPADVTLTFGRGDGTFGAPIHLAVYPYSLAVVDFDGDGYPDLTSLDLAAGAVVILRGSGDGSFSPWSTVPAQTYSTVAAD